MGLFAKVEIWVAHNPLFSPIVSALLSVFVAWIASARTVRLEVNKIRLSTQQLALAKLFDVRIREYPELYAILSDFPKSFENPSTVTIQLGEILKKVNAWDSKNSIFLGDNASNLCNKFRKTLIRAVLFEDELHIIQELLAAAEKLELALRGDLGIHGINLDDDDLDARERDSY